MAIVGQFPGVYANITDLSQVVTANSTTSCGYVGEAEFGPINTPTLITNLKKYNDIFGKLSPKYGYMGYSLAVAADTINQHWVVRVVDKNSAKYSAKKIALSGKTITELTSGYSVDEIEAAKLDSGALFTQTDESGTVTVDKESAFVITASNPNNRQYKVIIEDSTINENKKHRATQLEGTNAIASSETKAKVYVTLDSKALEEFEKDDNVMISEAEDKAYNDKFVVSQKGKTYYLSAAVDAVGEHYTKDQIVTIKNAKQSIQVKIIDATIDGFVKEIALIKTSGYEAFIEQDGTFETETATEAEGEGLTVKLHQIAEDNILVCESEDLTKTFEKSTIAAARIIKYPADNETTFSISVYETIGRMTTLIEKFNYVTLYENKDNYGNSTFIEDVINGKSNHILAFANPNAEENEIIPEMTAKNSFETLSGGTSGNKPTTKDLCDAWTLFNDRSQTYVTLLLNSGYVTENDYSYQSAMLSVAEKRRDCFCLFDVPMTATKEDLVVDWRKNTQGFTTYRGAAFTPWVKTFDTVQGKNGFNMAPSAYVAKIMGAANVPWVAAAGPNRGGLTSSVVTPTGLTEYYDETIGGNLYSNQLNCFIKDAVGYSNWGQKTLQQKPSALDRINVARTVIYIETTLRDAARYHLFENNTAFERLQITMQFQQFLDTVLNAEGISRYQVVCDESNNTPYIIANNQLVIDIYLWPTYTTEFIALNTIVMGPDAEITVSSN